MLVRQRSKVKEQKKSQSDCEPYGVVGVVGGVGVLVTWSLFYQCI